MSFKTFVNFSIFQTFTNLPNIAYCNIMDPESKTQLTLPLFVCVCWLRTSPTDPAVPIQTSEVPDTAACRRRGLPHLLSFNRVTYVTASLDTGLADSDSGTWSSL